MLSISPNIFLSLDLKQELNVKTRYGTTNGSQNGGLVGSGSEVTTPNGINGDIMLQNDSTTTTALNNTNTNSSATNINDYQLQQRSLKSKIFRSLNKTKRAFKFTKKYRIRD